MTDATYKPVGAWCGRHAVHPAHEGCTGVYGSVQRGKLEDQERALARYPECTCDLGPDSPTHRISCGTQDGNPLRELMATHRLYAEPEALDRLAETVAGMLDAAMHLEECWISDDETRCVCIVGKLRDAIPRCGHVEPVGVKGLTRQCLSTVHPSAPYKHVFGTV